MKNKSKMFRFLFTITVIFSSLVIGFTQTNSIEPIDIKKMTGSWTGTLTYVDYSSGNPYTMPCDVVINPIKENRKYALNYSYPDEPQANSTSKIKISKDGTKLAGEPVIARVQNEDRTIQITTEHSGKDGNDKKAAKIRNIYIFSNEKLIFKKEVKFDGTSEWKLRNEYNFNRR